jgi:RsiW-degrading membrane proteinase PrsW (M82 family)
MTYPMTPQPAVPGPTPTYLGTVQVPPLVPWHRRPMVRIGLSAAAIGVTALGGLIMVLILGKALGVAALVLAAVAALLPLPLLILCFVWLDRYEPEPWHYLAFAFGWGACVATAAAYFVNTLGDAVIKSIAGEDSKLAAVIVAPPVEETFKAAPLFLLLILTYFGRRHIHGVVDGIVYAGMSAVGFAFTENILYFGSQYVEASNKGTNRDGLVALFWIFVLRGVFSPFAHPLFTCLTGIGVGLAVRSRNMAVRVLAPVGGLLLAMVLHGTWNLLASSQNLQVIAIGYLVIMLPAFIAMVSVAIWVRAREAKVVSNALPAYVATGWLTPQEIASLSTMSARRSARSWARQVAGATGAKAMQDYQFSATKLAILRDGLLRGLTRAGQDYAEQERELLNMLAARRQLFLPYGLPPVVGFRAGGHVPGGQGPGGYGPGGHGSGGYGPAGSGPGPGGFGPGSRGYGPGGGQISGGHSQAGGHGQPGSHGQAGSHAQPGSPGPVAGQAGGYGSAAYGPNGRQGSGGHVPGGVSGQAGGHVPGGVSGQAGGHLPGGAPGGAPGQAGGHLPGGPGTGGAQGQADGYAQPDSYGPSAGQPGGYGSDNGGQSGYPPAGPPTPGTGPHGG